jgi:hypothetical protein
MNNENIEMGKEEKRMAKASLTLPNGTVVQIEGPPEEIRELLTFYGRQPTAEYKESTRKNVGQKKTTKKKVVSESLDYANIVNLVKDCDEAEAIEERILERTSMVDRTLLPLYVVHEHMKNKFALTSGEISKVMIDLGIPIAVPNVSNTLSGPASRYVMGDKVKKKGKAVRYTLSRRGVKYMKAVLEGQNSGE